MVKIDNIKLKTGIDMPVFGLGTWQLTGDNCTDIVTRALALGYRHIDTAEMYGNESEVGEGIRSSGIPRRELFVTSKVQPANLSYDSLIQACNDSLERLDTDYLDLYLIHWPNKNADMDEVFRGFKELIDSGKIKAMGVSNFTRKHILDAMPISRKYGVPITVNQVEYHPFLNQEELLDFSKEKEIVITAYSPLARGDVLRNDIIQKIGSKYDKSPAQVTLKWLMQKGMIVIPKASSFEHMKENYEITDFELSEEDMSRLDNLSENKRKVTPGWHEFDYDLGTA
ncbi:MAG: aldo/keto reductase [Candidatus Woesearchaeota archaeon]